MKAKILANGDLQLSITTREQRELRRDKRHQPDFDSDSYMREFMSEFMDKNGYEWSSPEDIGALTDAPILHSEDGKVWGHMSYQVESVQGELLKYRTCTWQSGNSEEEQTPVTKVFRTVNTEYVKYDGMIVTEQSPLDESEYDKEETGPMWKITLENGVIITVFDDEVVEKNSIDDLFYGQPRPKRKRASCPEHGTDTTFSTVAHVTQDWEVDCDGNFSRVIENCVETTHDPDFDNIWTCLKCGKEANIITE